MAADHNLFVNPEAATSLAVAINDGVDEISLLICAKTGGFPNPNPKKLKAEILSVIADSSLIDTLKYTRKGKILLVTRFASVAEKVLSMTELMGIPVDPFLFMETVSTRFLLHDIDPSLSCQEIAEELKESGMPVAEIRRFLRKEGGNFVPTKTVLVTKLGTSLPESIKLWYQLHRITLFCDKPRPCQNCFQYNHGTKGCNRPRICKSCGGDFHEMCSSPALSCHNCKGSHAADDKSCPTYLREVNIQKFKCSHHLTIGEARRRFSEVEKSDIRSYASAVHSPPSSPPLSQTLATKTDLEAAFHILSSTLQAGFDEIRRVLESQFRVLLDTLTCILGGRSSPQMTSPPDPPLSPVPSLDKPHDQLALNRKPSTDSTPTDLTPDCKKLKQQHDWTVSPMDCNNTSSTISSNSMSPVPLSHLQGHLLNIFSQWERNSQLAIDKWQAELRSRLANR